MSFRMWPALASWGAGLVHFAVGAAAPPMFLAAFVVIATLELAWGVAVLRSDRLVLPRLTLAASLSALLVSLAAALAGVMTWLPLVSATVMLVFIAGAAAIAVRRHARARDAGSQPATGQVRPGRTLVGFAAGAVLVAGLTTPALAATEAGEYAVPHGEMPGHHAH
ncbi:hypothetical protein M4I32_09945 [Microbacterium sp. LRZ72]|uniref:hypothetical protein n=1 Tax=Microbacterium sp. LRZ72 TaxID=2942481 RepID=UPI0029AAF9A3|nr:hypothetical protein [Microbacterium sp. LRZ72]MDX2377120.1 hypothetical protein [Microbacterium sp. LRZ72]